MRLGGGAQGGLRFCRRARQAPAAAATGEGSLAAHPAHLCDLHGTESARRHLGAASGRPAGCGASEKARAAGGNGESGDHGGNKQRLMCGRMEVALRPQLIWCIWQLRHRVELHGV